MRARIALRACSLVFLWVIIADSGACLDQNRAPAQSRAIMELTLERTGGALVVPVAVEFRADASAFDKKGEVVLKMVVDTGATLSGFDLRHAQCLGAPTGTVRFHGPTATTNTQKFRSPRMRIGRLAVEPTGDVTCLDLEPLTSAVGEKIDGLVGMDILGGLCFSIDFDLNKIVFYEKVDASVGQAIPLVRNRTILPGCCSVRATLGAAEELEFLIDTGAAWPIAGSLNESTYDALVARGELELAGSSSAVIAPTKSLAVKHARSKNFSLGGNTHEGLLFSRLKFPNCLGLGYLSRYFVLFDFPNSRMFLRPSKTFSRADVYDRVGLGLSQQAGELVVKHVEKGSPADDTGMQQGDSITAIDGESTANMTVLQAWQRLSADGKHFVVRTRNGDSRAAVIEIKAESCVAVPANKHHDARNDVIDGPVKR